RRVPEARLGRLVGFYTRLSVASLTAAAAAWASMQWLARRTGAEALEFSTALGNQCGGQGEVACRELPRVADQWLAVAFTGVQTGFVFVGVFALL
ncbi:UNVERIFIED_CONTAM: hypothetical protein NY603_21280, partial [Bacteroidetes bacterium 56_B9]